jgi:hypothetical protein
MSDTEKDDNKNILKIDNNTIELSEFVTSDEIDSNPKGFYIESYLIPKSVILNELECDFNGEGYGVSLFFISSKPNFIDPGTYKITTNDLQKNEAGGELDYFIDKSSKEEEELIEGVIEVVKENDKYTLKLEAKTEKSKKITFYFEGNLKILSGC